MADRFPGIFLLAAVFIIAVCGLIYELIAAALSSYLLGSSVTQFSIVIGVFLTAMGLGSYLTRFVKKDLPDFFVAIQVAIGLSGGLSAAILLLSFAALPAYFPVLIAVLMVTGSLVGMEIPILIRILRSQEALRITVSNVLALDYFGALIASLAFPILLVPYLGLLRTSFVFGLINISVAAIGLRVMKEMLRKKKRIGIAAGFSSMILLVGLAGSGMFTSLMENLLYQDDIVLTRQTPYQRIVVTRWRDDIRLFIDGHLQFSSVDEYRYHEALVHPAMSAFPGARKILILGGGDGMTAREVLKYNELESIDLVDLDAEMIKLFKERPLLAALSDNALSHPKLKVHIADAGKFLESSNQVWDAIFIDLPDPSSLSLARLYTKSFYRLIARHLNRNGIVTTQATSPFYAPDAFWCIANTLAETPVDPEALLRFNIYPYHVYVPSFGDWGFVMASMRPIELKELRLRESIPLRFLSAEILPTLFVFPKDSMTGWNIQSNKLDNQILVQYYRKSWKRFNP